MHSITAISELLVVFWCLSPLWRQCTRLAFGHFNWTTSSSMLDSVTLTFSSKQTSSAGPSIIRHGGKTNMDSLSRHERSSVAGVLRTQLWRAWPLFLFCALLPVGAAAQ